MKPQATRRDPDRLNRILTVIGEGLLLTFICTLFYLAILFAAAVEPVESEQRCFTTAVHSENYCRSQRQWSIQ